MAMFSPEYGLRRTLTDALEDELYHISNKFYPDEDLTLSSTTLASQHSSPTFSTPTKDGIAASAIAHTTTSAPTAAPVPIPTSNDTLAAEPWQGLDLTRALDDLERQFGAPTTSLAADNNTLSMSSPRTLPVTPPMQSVTQFEDSSISSVDRNIFNKFSYTAMGMTDDASTVSPPRQTVSMRNLINPQRDSTISDQFNGMIAGGNSYLPTGVGMNFTNPITGGPTVYTHDGFYCLDNGFDEFGEFEFPLQDGFTGLNGEDAKVTFSNDRQQRDGDIDNDDNDNGKVFGTAVDMDLEAFNNLYSEDQLFSNSLGTVSTLSSRSSSRSTFSELSGDCPSEISNVSHSVPTSSNTLSNLEFSSKKPRDSVSNNVTKMTSKNGRKRNSRGKSSEHLSHASAEILKSMLGQVQGIQNNNDSTSAQNESLDDEIYTCRLVNLTTKRPCLAQFSRSYDLTRHQNTVHAKKKLVFRCSECIKKMGLDGYDRTFSRLDALTRHCKTKHEHLTLEERQRVTKFAKENIGYVVD